MNWTQNCSLLSSLFVAAIVSAVGGNVFGVIAWRHRTHDQARWRWLIDPTYAFRARYYNNPAQFPRYAAMSLLLVAAALIVVLGAAVIIASQRGARNICGFAL
jgi:hypothetical protein